MTKQTKRAEKKAKDLTPDVRRAMLLLSFYEEAPTSSTERRIAAKSYAARAESLGATVETVVHGAMSPHPLDDQRTGLTPEQRTAGEQINDAFMLITGGATVRGMDWSGAPRGGAGGERESEYIVRLQRDYSRWCETCKTLKIARHIILAFVIDGISAKRLDRASGCRNGRSMDIIRRGLDAFAEIRGIKERQGSYRFIGEILNNRAA